jgi:hypothetical protein
MFETCIPEGGRLYNEIYRMSWELEGPALINVEFFELCLVLSVEDG